MSPSFRHRAGRTPVLLGFAALTFAVLGLAAGRVRLGATLAIVILIVGFAAGVAERRTSKRGPKDQH